jgi:hypothetical protein
MIVVGSLRDAIEAALAPVADRPVRVPVGSGRC